MTSSEVIDLAHAEGITLRLTGNGEAILLLPRGRASTTLRAVVRAHKSELLSLLASRGPPRAAATDGAAHPAAAGAPAHPPRRMAPPNTTPTPDIFFDEIAPTLKEGELRVMLYLIRRTFGFKREGDKVSLSQFCQGIVRPDGRRLDHGTGLARQHVLTALAGLEAKGLVRRLGGKAGRGHVATYVLVLAGEHGANGKGEDQEKVP